MIQQELQNELNELGVKSRKNPQYKHLTIELALTEWFTQQGQLQLRSYLQIAFVEKALEAFEQKLISLSGLRNLIVVALTKVDLEDRRVPGKLQSLYKQHQDLRQLFDSRSTYFLLNEPGMPDAHGQKILQLRSYLIQKPCEHELIDLPQLDALEQSSWQEGKTLWVA